MAIAYQFSQDGDVVTLNEADGIICSIAKVEPDDANYNGIFLIMRDTAMHNLDKPTTDESIMEFVEEYHSSKTQSTMRGFLERNKGSITCKAWRE